MNYKALSADIKSQLDYWGISRAEAAAAGQMSDRSLRTKLKDPMRFTLGELIDICDKAGIKITYEVTR